MKKGFAHQSLLFLSLLFKSYKHTKFGVMMLIASLVVAASGLSAVLVINNSAKQSYSAGNTLLVPNVSYQVVANNAQHKITKQDYALLRRLGFDSLIAVARARAHVFQSATGVATGVDQTATENTQSKYIQKSQRSVDFTGIDTFALIANQALLGTDNNSANRTASSKVGEESQSADRLIGLSFSRPIGFAHPQLLEQLLSSSAQQALFVEIKETPSQNQVGYRALPELLALEDPSLGNDIVMDIGVFSQVFPNSDLVALLWIQDASSPDFEQHKQHLADNLPSHLSLAALSSADEQGELTKSFHLNLLAMALLMFVVCLFIVLNAVNLLINSRMSWLKVCRQLGIGRSVLFSVQLLEVSIITLLSVIVGLFVGLQLALLASPSVQATLEGLYNLQVGYGRTSIFSLFLQVFGISLCGTIAAVFIPFQQVNKRLSQTQSSAFGSLSQSSGVAGFKKSLPFLLAGILFGLVSLILLNLSTQLWLLLVAAACLILAGCSALLMSYPIVLKWVYAAIPKHLHLLRVSTQRSIVLSGKTKIACCAFFIAATSNIGMNLMVDSFRGATVSWLDSRLASDYYLYYRGDQDIMQLNKIEQITITPRLENQIQYKDQRVQQFSYPITEQFKQAMVFYEVDDIEQTWQDFEQGSATLINQQFAFHFNVTIGNTLKLPHPSTGVLSDYVVKGIIYDFGSPNKQVLLPVSDFTQDKSRSSIYAIEANEQSIIELKNALLKLGIDHENILLKTEELLALSMNAFDNTFIITDGLNIVTLLVAALSLACAIIVLMGDVRPQNMLIRSMGVSAFKTQALTLFQYFLLCAVALAFATPFGILLSHVLIFDINYQAFQWTYPLQISPLKIVQIYGVSLLVVFIVIVAPIVRASRKPLIEDIRWLN